MKRQTTLLLAFFFLFFGKTQAQCPDPNATLAYDFDTQSDIWTFVINYPNCTEIPYLRIYYEGDYCSEAVYDLSPLSGITRIEGTLTIHDAVCLNGISGLENLTYIESLYLIGESISDFSDFATMNVDTIGSIYVTSSNSIYGLFGGVQSLDGIENIGYVGAFSCLDNPYISSLEPLGQIEKIRGISLEEMSLTNLDGLESLDTIDNGLAISFCWNLSDISALENLSSVGNIDFQYNDQLSTCNLPFICEHIATGKPYTISNNAPGCNTDLEIIESCIEYAKINSHFFYDINQNQVQDAGEPDYLDASVIIEPDNLISFTNPQNDNIVYVELGNYTVSYHQVNTPDWQLSTDSSSYFLSLEEEDCDTIVFGLYPTEQLSNFQGFISSPPTRCNEFITFDISTKNLGTTTADGTLWLEVDENILATNFIDMPDTTVAPNLYGWFFDDLFPSQSLTRQIDLQIPGPPDFPVGDYLFFDAYANFEDQNGGQSSQIFAYEAEVRCSYDPNDKLVNPARQGDYTLFDENIIYTIRFQNTGNDVAYDVVVRDTLDANLDLESFNVLGSSHADKLQTSMTNEGILTFEFRDIFLPDSTSNLEGSQGYVTYMISAIDGLAENTPITNSAGIYFDLNPPIITNTTQSLMVSELPVVSTTLPDSAVDFIISPNPNTGIFQVNGIPQGTYQIHDTAGRIIQSGEMENDLSIDISTEAQGVYFMSIHKDNEVITKRIIKL